MSQNEIHCCLQYNEIMIIIVLPTSGASLRNTELLQLSFKGSYLLASPNEFRYKHAAILVYDDEDGDKRG